MKSFFIVFLFLTTVVSASVADLSCFCFEDTTVHVTDEHKDSTSGEEKDHCQHQCSQCHLVALIPEEFLVFQKESYYSSDFAFSFNLKENLNSLLYRPPIS